MGESWDEGVTVMRGRRGFVVIWWRLLSWCWDDMMMDEYGR